MSFQNLEALLFDMDGTILDSISVANRIWARWANSHGLDPEPILAAMHGVRVEQTMRRFAPPGTDIEREASLLTQAEIEDVAGIVEIAGARRLLSSLPVGRWAIVTSAPRALALARLKAAGLPVPGTLVTAEDVTVGKPAPDCYLLAARRLGMSIQRCLVWEDAPAGIQAAEAAGARVVVVSATHGALRESAHPVVRDYDDVDLDVGIDGTMRIELGQRRPASS